MLRVLMIVFATFHLIHSAPFSTVSATEDHHLVRAPKILLSLTSDDIDEQDNEDGLVEPAESSPDADPEAGDELLQRALRSKNFLRFGRSDGITDAKNSKDGGSKARFSRGTPDDNFIRLGRQSNFIRLGRRENDGEPTKTLSTRGANSNFIRLGRDKMEPSNFIRFGRGNSGFIRFGRNGNEEITDGYEDDSNSTIERLPRANTLDSNFIRFGRRELLNSNFMRLGRSDNFLRFGKGENYLRFGRGSADNFIRFGRGGSPDNLFGRWKLTDRNFIRLGRSGTRVNEEDVGVRQIRDSETGKPSVKSSTKYIRFGKRDSDIQDVNNKFMRFGRDIEHEEVIPQDRYSANNRSKRSLVPEDEIVRSEVVDDFEDRPEAEQPFRYYSSLTGVPFAPELAALPSYYAKRALGNDNFIRFG